jgi:PAS domain S-box-containing protein
MSTLADVAVAERAPSFLAHGGVCGLLIASRDWSGTSLGSLSHWPQSLRTACGILLRSPVPMVMLWGEDGVMLYNDAYSAFAGKRHPELLGSPVREGWPEVAAFNAHVMEVVLAGGTLAYRDQELTLLRHGTPEQVFMNLDYSPVPDEQGKPAGVLCVLSDTTERVMAERARSESEQRLRLAAEGARVGLWDWDLVRLEGWWSPRTAEIMGVADGESITPEQRLALVHPDDRESLQLMLMTALGSGTDFLHEYRIVRPDGAVRHIASRGIVVRDADGRAVRTTGMVIDVTDERVAATRLRESEERLRFLDRLNEATLPLTDATEIMAVTARLLGEQLGAAICAYADMEPDEDGFTIRGDWAAPGASSIVGSYSLAAFGQTAYGRLRAGRAFVTRDALAELGAEEAALLLRLGLEATVCMPLIKEGRLTALMAVHSATPRDWTPADLSLIAETTQRSWANIERTRADELLRDREARLRLAVDAGRMAVFDHDFATDVLASSPELNRLLGFPPGRRLTIDDVRACYEPGEIERLRALRAASVERGDPFVEAELRMTRADGEARWFMLRAETRLGPDGSGVGSIGVILDINDRKRAEEHQRLLVNELNHRVKNTLSIIQGIAQQTFRGPGIPAQARAAFEGRLGALAATHNLLTQQNWEAAPIRQVIGDAVAAVTPRKERVEIEGPDLLLSPKTAVSLGMAVHELCTNALKYGGLSVPEGRVEVRWRIEDGRLKLVWRERGGPEVREPETRGFGTRLIERGLAAELGGTATIAFERQGLVCAVDAPLPRADA